MEYLLHATKGNRILRIEKSENDYYSADMTGGKFPNIRFSKNGILNLSSGEIGENDFLDSDFIHQLRIMKRIAIDCEYTKNTSVFSDWLKHELKYEGWNFEILHG
jgi:hypothetical protein